MNAVTNDVYRRQGFGGSFKDIAPTALLLVDFCNAFADAEFLGGGNIAAAAGNSLHLLLQARARGWPVAHSQIVFPRDGSNENAWFEKVPALRMLVQGQPGTEFLGALAPRADELVIQKTVPSAFFQSSLAPWLAAQGVRGLVIAGCTTSGCVRASAVDALSHGFKPLVASDCVGDRGLEAHFASLTDLAAKYAEVATAEALLRRLDAPAGPSDTAAQR